MALKYTIGLTPATAADVLTGGHREVSLTVGDNPTTVTELPGNATSHVFEVERDLAVALSLVDVDSSGNKSQPSPTLVFTSTDTVPPAAPGDLTVLTVEQTD